MTIISTGIISKIRIITLFGFMIILYSCSAYRMTDEAKAAIAGFDAEAGAYTKIELLKNTPNQTPAFIFDSGIQGPAVLILGGTHGDEPAGYEAALRLFKEFRANPPKKGKIILIPLANRVAVNNYNRRIPVPDSIDYERGNLNRCYPGKKDGLPMEQMAWHIQELAKDNNVKLFIDLHEARYLHLDTPPESIRDQGLGQTLIFYPNESSSWLVLNMLDQINDMIENPDEKFSSVEEPILHSGAWWAGSELKIAAFTFETMRMFDLNKRINFHLNLVHIALEVIEVW